MEKNKTTLSALIVAHNEEEMIEDCLKSVLFTDEIVVVLDRCTDKTKEICKKYKAKLVEGAWPIEGDRRNTGIQTCTSDWIIELDADERVTEELAQEILDILPNTHYDNFTITFHNYIGDTLVKYGWGAYWGVMQNTRLFKKDKKIWGQQIIHPSVTLTGHKGTLSKPINHFVDKDISDMLRRLDRYTSARAKDIKDQNIKETYGKNIKRIFSRFYKCYISRKGYREGKYGFLIALMAGLYPILSYLRYQLEISKNDN